MTKIPCEACEYEEFDNEICKRKHICGKLEPKPSWEDIRAHALLLLNLYGVKEKMLEENPEALNVFLNEIESLIRQTIKTEREEAVKELIEEIEKFELDNDYSGSNIEILAEKFNVPVSVMAIRLFDVRKEEFIDKLKAKYEAN